MINEEWRAWLDQSRAKQAQLNQGNYAMPSQGWQDPQAIAPMQGSFSQASQPTDNPMSAFTAQPNGLPSGWGGNAPGWHGQGSMMPVAQLNADNEWERQNAWRQQELDKIPEHIPWGDPRIQAVMNAQVPAGTYGGIPGPVQPLTMVPQQTPAQLADWERYKRIMANQRPYQGLR